MTDVSAATPKKINTPDTLEWEFSVLLSHRVTGYENWLKNNGAWHVLDINFTIRQAVCGRHMEPIYV